MLFSADGRQKSTASSSSRSKLRPGKNNHFHCASQGDLNAGAAHRAIASASARRASPQNSLLNCNSLESTGRVQRLCGRHIANASGSRLNPSPPCMPARPNTASGGSFSRGGSYAGSTTNTRGGRRVISKNSSGKNLSSSLKTADTTEWTEETVLALRSSRSLSPLVFSLGVVNKRGHATRLAKNGHDTKGRRTP